MALKILFNKFLNDWSKLWYPWAVYLLVKEQVFPLKMKREVCASWEKMLRWRFFHNLFDTLNLSCNSGWPRYWLPRDVNMWETTCLYLFTLGHVTFLINVWHVVQFMISGRKIRSVCLYINYINYALSPRLSRRLVPGSFEHPLLHSLLLVRYRYREMRSALA
jgi:hypothetical protein